MRHRILVHEYGHALGLADIYVTRTVEGAARVSGVAEGQERSIMTYGDGSETTTPTAEDLHGLRRIIEIIRRNGNISAAEVCGVTHELYIPANAGDSPAARDHGVMFCRRRTSGAGAAPAAPAQNAPQEGPAPDPR
jgi:hypothetical protein